MTQNYEQRRVITADSRKIARIIRDCLEQLYGNKSDQMNKFLEKYTFLRLNQKEIKFEKISNAWGN